MMHQVIAGWNASLHGANVCDGAYYGLMHRVEYNSDGTDKHCETAWLPTPRELELLNEGASITLRMRGRQVAVDLSVKDNPDGR